MKKSIILLLSVCSLTIFAQQPAWYNDAQRNADYPSGKYFTGFAEGQRLANERQDVATKRIQASARTEAASTIRVHIQSIRQYVIVSRVLS